MAFQVETPVTVAFMNAEPSLMKQVADKSHTPDYDNCPPDFIGKKSHTLPIGYI